MKDDSLSNDRGDADKFLRRRAFVKRSVAASLYASQPMIFSGLIRAEGGGGGQTTTGGWTTTGPEPTTTGGWTTTVAETTTEPWTTVPWTTTEPVTTEAITHYDIVGSASADGNAISFEPSLDDVGYGQSTIWEGGEAWNFKLKFFASILDGNDTPHGDPLKIECAGEFFRAVNPTNTYTTQRVGLRAEVIDQGTGEISATRLGPVEELLYRDAAAATVFRYAEDDEDEEEPPICKYLVFPKMRLIEIVWSYLPQTAVVPRHARLTGKVKFWTVVDKYLPNGTGGYTKVQNYDPTLDADAPGGGVDLKPFVIDLISHGPHA